MSNQKTMKFKVCTDPKHLAYATWSILSNNPVSKNYFLMFSFLDLVILVFYAFLLIQRVHSSNFEFDQDSIISSSLGTSDLKNYTSDSLLNIGKDEQVSQMYNSKAGIQMQFLRSLDIALFNMAKDNVSQLMIISGIIMAVSVFALAIIFLMAIFIKNHQGLEKQNLFKKMFCCSLVMILSFLHMPMFDVLIRTIVASMACSDIRIQITGYIIGSLAIIFFSLLMLFLVRIFNLCVPTDDIPWCSPISKLVFLNLMIKATLVICISFDIEGKYSIIQVIILFILQTFQASYRVLFAPNYIKQIDIFVKTKDFAFSLIFFIGIVCKIVGDTYNYDMVYFILFIPVLTAGWIQFEIYRKQTIILKIKQKSLKLEIEYEFALYLMMTLVRDSITDKATNQKVFGELMDLMLNHIEDCDDQLCICDEMENFYELLRLKQLHNQEVFPLLRAERKKYKKIIDDQGLIGTISSITDLTLKTHSTSETSTVKSNNDQERQDQIDEMQEKFNRDKMDDSENKENIKGQSNTKKEEQKKKQRNSTIYKINIDETKHRFLSELLYLFYFEMKNKFPNSFKIQLLQNYFSLKYKRREMLCVFQMRSFNISKLSKLDQCCHYVNEQFLLNEINKSQKLEMSQSQNQQEGNFNGDYFIKMNQLYKEFNICIELLSSNVVNFWKIFEKSGINVETTQKLSTKIAHSIKSVFKIFSHLDTIKVFKDYQMYFQFAIVQLHILNDPVAYELYVGKMKSILEINKIYQKNFSNNKSSDYNNFIIVDANGSKFGQIIQSNNSFRQLLEWSEDQAKKFRIENFMPQLIQEKHLEFMTRYNKTGQSYIINNKVTMFLKKSNGYIIPVELYIKFHYSIDYQYVFLAIVRPFYEMAPFSNGVKYNINQLIFLMTDNDMGKIYEYSESCRALLNLSQKIDSSDIIKKISDFIQDIDFTSIKNTRQQRYLTNEIYEETHRIDVSYFSEASEENSSITFRNRYSQLGDKIKFAKTRVFEERYSGGVLDLNIFCFFIVNEYDKSLLGTSFSSKFPGSITNQLELQANTQQQPVTNFEKQDVIVEVDEQSSSCGSSSYQSSTTSMAEFRNFHSFTEQNTPRSLKLIIQLIVALYIIMMVVASVNLGLNLTRQLQSESDIHTVRQSFDRMNWLSMNQLIVRVLLNIANGYETDNSSLIQDRFNTFKKFQFDRIALLKYSQSYLMQTSFVLSDEFKAFSSNKNINLYYLSEQNKPYIKQENLDISMNLYISKLTELNSYTKQQMQGNLNIQTLTPRLDSAYKPSQYEQNIFFLVENGNRELRQFVITSTEMYARESEQHAEQNIASTKITAIISIVTIVIISLVIAPILTQAEIRKYKALLYFLKIPKDKLPDLIKNCEYCLNMNDEGRYLQIMRDYESFLGIRLVNQQVDQLRQAREERINISNQVSRERSAMGGDTNYGDSMLDDHTSSNIHSQSNDQNSTVRSRAFEGSIRSGGNSSGMKGSNQFSKIGSDHNKVRLPTIIQEEIENDGEMGEIGEDHKEVQENLNKLNLDALNLKQNRNNNKKRKTSSSESETEENGASVKGGQVIDEQEQQDKQELSSKQKQINNRAYKRRSTVIFGSLTVILLLSMYFIIAYFMAMNTFQTASDVIKYLEIIFYKGSCFDSAMNFLRENQIRNQSLQLNLDDNLNAADYYIDLCFKKEIEYNQMRTNMPAFFKDIKPFIDKMESSNFCDYIYTGVNEDLKPQCKTALNGLLNKGLTNAFYYLLTQILKGNLNFNSLGSEGQRTKQALEQAINDIDTIQIINMKAKILDPALNQLKTKCMDSVITYIQGLLNDFVAAFVVFSAILTMILIILIFIGFRTLRQSMWDTNIILKIIPFETLPREDRVQIKDFFNS